MRIYAWVCVWMCRTDKQSNGREEERGRSGVTEGDRNGRGKGRERLVYYTQLRTFFYPPFFIAFFSWYYNNMTQLLDLDIITWQIPLTEWTWPGCSKNDGGPLTERNDLFTNTTAKWKWRTDGWLTHAELARLSWWCQMEALSVKLSYAIHTQAIVWSPLWSEVPDRLLWNIIIKDVARGTKRQCRHFACVSLPTASRGMSEGGEEIKGEWINLKGNSYNRDLVFACRY